ncbi:unnamed protein product [Phyllotreta striolata]|uniref:CHK kinase-like domain-containing protein n=1 Tax=Phyllotreta striolata TaxID=444603 RepID=A0A9N9XMK4_PHYSR|nr:unnamed protein product [Phyllotreta striolata]
MTWSCGEIKNLDALLSNYLGETKTIHDVKIKKLSQPGENLGSIIYGLDITVKHKNDENEELLHVIAKVLPKAEHIREMFEIQTTYTNEMAFYKIIIPTLKELQEEHGIRINLIEDHFAKCYSVRKNLLGNDDKIDDDAVLLLENLISTGFINIDKRKGFDIDTAQMVLRSLVQFHGVSLALKIKKPDLFKRNILPYCNNFFKKGSIFSTAIDLFGITVNKNEETKEILSKIKGWNEVDYSSPKEPFSTLVHDDLWTNNTMQKFENGKPVSNKLVDFQLITHASPAADLFFYIWTSIPLPLIKTHLDHFIKYYHDNLIGTLQLYGIDTAPFSFQAFLDEIENITPFQIIHAAYFTIIAIHGPKGGFNPDRLPTIEELYSAATDEAREKIWYMVKECHRRGWFK